MFLGESFGLANFVKEDTVLLIDLLPFAESDFHPEIPEVGLRVLGRVKDGSDAESIRGASLRLPFTYPFGNWSTPTGFDRRHPDVPIQEPSNW